MIVAEAIVVLDDLDGCHSEVGSQPVAVVALARMWHDHYDAGLDLQLDRVSLRRLLRQSNNWDSGEHVALVDRTISLHRRAGLQIQVTVAI